MEASLQNNLLDKHDFVRDIIQPTKWYKRLLSLLLDLFFSYVSLFILFFILGIIIESAGGEVEEITEVSRPLVWAVFLTLFVGYNITFESIFGKTLGKMITNTKVVSEDGAKAAFRQIVGRSLARLIPVDCFTFLSRNPRGWHDTLSETIVVDDIEPYRLEEVLQPDEEPFE